MKRFALICFTAIVAVSVFAQTPPVRRMPNRPPQPNETNTISNLDYEKILSGVDTNILEELSASHLFEKTSPATMKQFDELMSIFAAKEGYKIKDLSILSDGIEWDCDGTNGVIIVASGNVLRFSAEGRLLSIRNFMDDPSAVQAEKEINRRREEAAKKAGFNIEKCYELVRAYTILKFRSSPQRIKPPARFVRPGSQREPGRPRNQ